MERTLKHGFLPVSIDKRPFGISNFGIRLLMINNNLILPIFWYRYTRKNTSNATTTTTLLIVGGALIGTTELGVSITDRGGWIAAFLTVSATGYVIMGLGLSRAIQRRRATSKIV